jgi:hypothetical protein
MSSKISSFAEMEEPNRVLFIAQLHHAMWHDERLFSSIDAMLKKAVDNVPEAIYFPNGEQIENPINDIL